MPIERVGVRFIRVAVDAAYSDIEPVVRKVKAAESVQSFEGDLWLVFETSIEARADEESEDYLQGSRGLARFDDETGERLQ